MSEDGRVKDPKCHMDLLVNRGATLCTYLPPMPVGKQSLRKGVLQKPIRSRDLTASSKPNCSRQVHK